MKRRKDSYFQCIAERGKNASTLDWRDSWACCCWQGAAIVRSHRPGARRQRGQRRQHRQSGLQQRSGSAAPQPDASWKQQRISRPCRKRDVSPLARYGRYALLAATPAPTPLLLEAVESARQPQSLTFRRAGVAAPTLGRREEQTAVAALMAMTGARPTPFHPASQEQGGDARIALGGKQSAKQRVASRTLTRLACALLSSQCSDAAGTPTPGPARPSAVQVSLDSHSSACLRCLRCLPRVATAPLTAWRHRIANTAEYRSPHAQEGTT